MNYPSYDNTGPEYVGGHKSITIEWKFDPESPRDAEIRNILIGAYAATDRVLGDVMTERRAQDDKWGTQNHPDGTGLPEFVLGAEQARDTCNQEFSIGTGTWTDIMFEELYEALAEEDTVKLRAELVQVAAVAVAWIEDIDRRTDND